ncbi:MAG TPA: ABC transporter ATP-binding protein, partial [candidate division Zixibacteria bacterium]|nr:ABC transporter ATP-binding protein [candidate division Zixibacteria bacterium]
TAECELSLRDAARQLAPLFAPYKLGIALCVFMLMLVSALIVGKGLLIRHAIDDNMANRDWDGLLLTVGLYLLAQLTLLGLTYFQRMKLERIGQTIIAGLKERLFGKILGLSLSFFDRNAPGRLMARVESDTDSLRMMFTFAVTVIIGDLLLLTGIFITMLIISPRLTVITMIAVPAAFALTWLYHRYTTNKFLESRKRMADITSRITEFLQGIAQVQIFNRTGYAREKIREVNREKFMLDSRVHVGSTTYFNIVFYIEAVLIAAILLFGGAWLTEGLVTVGVIVMFIQFLRKMFEPIYRFSEELYVVQKALAGLRRIYGLLAVDESIPQPAEPLGVSRLQNSIAFDHVWFSYGGNDVYALEDVSFTIKRGERVALVGATGGGKSSIVNLLLRFYDPQRGRVTIDGHDIRTMTKDELRGLFGLVLQDIYLFPGDISSNISLGSDNLTAADIERAAETVGAAAFIRRMPGGFQAEVAERGGNLSRGERQLLSFARALAFDPQVLILDEATSSVDPETERAIQDALTRLLANRTSLIVAHRLSTILACDTILVVRDGRIVERGTHEELVKAGGYYHDLFFLQFAPEADRQLDGEREVDIIEEASHVKR